LIYEKKGGGKPGSRRKRYLHYQGRNKRGGRTVSGSRGGTELKQEKSSQRGGMGFQGRVGKQRGRNRPLSTPGGPKCSAWGKYKRGKTMAFWYGKGNKNHKTKKKPA